MPMISDDSPVRFCDPLPSSVDVVVVGGGVVGAFTAYFLIRSGLSVLLLDKGRVAGEQSSRNWGWIRQQGRDAAELPIVIDALNTWAGLAEETGEDFGFARHGVLYLADDDAALARLERWLDVAHPHQLDSKMLSSSEVDALIRDKPGQYRGALYTPSDGRAEPFIAVPKLAGVLQKRGCAIRERCAVRSIDVEAGRVTGVVTEAGRVRAQSVVIATGAWSSLFMDNLGIRLPQLTVRATVARTAPAPNVFDGAASAPEIAFRRRADGGYTIAAGGMNEHFIGADSLRFLRDYVPALRTSRKMLRLRLGDGFFDRMTRIRRWSPDEITPFERTRVLNPEPSTRAVRKMREGLAVRLPSLGQIPFVEAWAGMIDMMPDVVPVMDEVDAYPGLHLATGFSGHGFGIGPGAGRVMSDLVQGNTVPHALERFRLARFSDGSPMIPGPGL